jgi:hypothetical protein
LKYRLRQTGQNEIEFNAVRGSPEWNLWSQMSANQKLTFEAVIFMLFGGVCFSILITMRGSVSYAKESRLIDLAVGIVLGLVSWTLYRMTRFVITG